MTDMRLCVGSPLTGASEHLDDVIAELRRHEIRGLADFQPGDRVFKFGNESPGRIPAQVATLRLGARIVAILLSPLCEISACSNLLEDILGTRQSIGIECHVGSDSLLQLALPNLWDHDVSDELLSAPAVNIVHQVIEIAGVYLRLDGDSLKLAIDFIGRY